MIQHPAGRSGSQKGRVLDSVFPIALFLVLNRVWGLGAGVAAVLNLWSVDLGERGMRRKVCGFAGVCLGGFLGAVAGVLYRVL